MNKQEVATTTVVKEQVSDIHVMDIIPGFLPVERPNAIPRAGRPKMGRAVIDKALGVNLTHLENSVIGNDNYKYETNATTVGFIDEKTVLGDDLDKNEVQDTPARKRLIHSLGRAAALANIKLSQFVGAASPQERKERAAAHREKYASDKADWYQKPYYALRRNQVRIAGWTPVAIMGSIALERFGMAGVHMDNFLEHSAFTDAVVATTPYESQLPELPKQESIPTLLAGSSVYVAGGAGQGDIPQAVIDEMHAKGMDLGVDIEGVHYSAQIGPVVGVERMDVSGAGGANSMYNQSIDDLKAGKPVQYVGYSEGTLVAIDAYDRAVAANGGTPPANLLPPILVAAPYAQGGIFDNSLTGGMVGNVLNGMGIPTDRKLPPGTIIKYYDSDIYANGGNMNPATLIKNALGLAAGNHDIPNDSDPHYSFTDSDGVIHVVYSRDDQFLTLLEKSGIKVLDTENANKAFEAFFPIGKDENGEFLKPDVRAGLNYIAVTLDHQIDPSGTTHVVQDFMNSLPDEYKELGQRGLDGFNNIAEMAGKIQSGEVDPMTGFMSIMGSLSSIMGGLQGISNVQGGQSSFPDWSTYSQGSIDFSSYLSDGDYSECFEQMQNLAHAYMTECNDYMQTVASSHTQQPYVHSDVTQIPDQMQQYTYDLLPQTTPQLRVEQPAFDTPVYETPATVPTESYQSYATSVPEVITPHVTASDVPATEMPVVVAPVQVVEQAPVTPPVEYTPPVPEIASQPEPAIVEAPAQAPAVDAPAEIAPTPPPAVYEAPAPVEAPASAPEAPAPVVDAPPALAPAPVFPVFEAPSLQSFLPSQSFDSGPSSSFSPSSTPSFSSSDSSSSSPLVSSSVSE